MVRPSSGKKLPRSPAANIVLGVVIVAFGVLLYRETTYINDTVSLASSDVLSIHAPGSTATKSTTAVTHVKVEPSSLSKMCQTMPILRPSGVFLLDEKYKEAQTLESLQIAPTFSIASALGGRVSYHMKGDAESFDLLKSVVLSGDGGTSLDIGANQGFFTYYLASLGSSVHAFEMNPDNFRALEHGVLYNPRAVSERVHLYNVGISNGERRAGFAGSMYESRLSSGGGPILQISLDCFADHVGLPTHLPFVKVDVEGFEIPALEGGAQFFKRTSIDAMLVEVGPKRWGRADVTFERGVDVLSSLPFKNMYVLVRSHVPGCPLALANVLSSREATTTLRGNVHMHPIKDKMEWNTLLKEMEKNDYDCNFWFTESSNS